MAWTLLIRNGTVVDGSGAPGYAADVAVEGDRIVAVERRVGVAVEGETVGRYLERLRQAKPSINIVHFVGHGALRLAALGPENRPPSASEQQAMERLLQEALEAGGVGFSTGLVYPPSAYAATPELVALAKSMAHRGGLYFSHIRGEAATLEAAIDEAIQIGEGAGVSVQIAHIKASGRENWNKMDAALRKVSDARARGVDGPAAGCAR